MRPGTRRRIGILSLVVAGATGCEEPWQTALRDARAATPDLAVARTKGLPAPAPRTRIVVRADGVGVDQADLVASWSEETRAALGPRAVASKQATRLRGFQAPGDPARPQAMLLPGLLHALEAAALLEKERSEREPDARFEGAVELAIDREAPYDLVARVLYTAGQAEYGRWNLRLRGPGGEASWLEVTAPRIRQDPDPRPSACASPDLDIGPTGILVRAGPADHLARAVAHPALADGVLSKRLGTSDTASLLAGSQTATAPGTPATPAPPAPPAEPAWMGVVMLGPSGACPSVPRRGDGHDTRALVALLAEIAAMAPGCQTARVRAASPTRFQDLASVLEAVQIETPFVEPALAMPESDAAPSCVGGARPARD